MFSTGVRELKREFMLYSLLQYIIMLFVHPTPYQASCFFTKNIT